MIDRDAEAELREWVRAQESPPQMASSIARAAVEHAGQTRQVRGAPRILLAMVAAATIGVAGLAVVSIGGTFTAAPARVSPAASNAVGPTVGPSVTAASPTEIAPQDFGWYVFNWYREGDHVEGPQNPAGSLHMELRTGRGQATTGRLTREVASPDPPIEEGAAPFATSVGALAVYGFTSTEGAEIHLVGLVDGSDTRLLTIQAAVPAAVLDIGRNTVYLARFGLTDRRYEGVWAVPLDGSPARQLLGGDGIPDPLGARVDLFLSTTQRWLAVLECYRARPCAVRGWDLVTGEATPTAEVVAANVVGFGDHKIVVGDAIVDLANGTVETFPSCGAGTVVAKADGGSLLVYEADQVYPGTSHCPGVAYRLVVRDLTTGHETKVELGTAAGDIPLRLVAPDALLGLDLPDGTILLAPEGESLSSPRARLIAVP